MTPAMTSSNLFMAGFYYCDAFWRPEDRTSFLQLRIVIGRRRYVAEVDSRSPAGIGRVRRRPDADHLERQAIAVDFDDDEMMRILVLRRSRLHQMLHAYVLASARCEVRAQIGFADVGVDRRAATAGDERIHPIG